MAAVQKETMFRVLKHLRINTLQPILAGLFFGSSLSIELYQEWKIQTYGTKQLVGALSGPCSHPRIGERCCKMRFISDLSPHPVDMMYSPHPLH